MKSTKFYKTNKFKVFILNRKEYYNAQDCSRYNDKICG